MTLPDLAPWPRGVPRRLIDAGRMCIEASAAGQAERYRSGETPQTVHVWWARRPHRAMRALVYASLNRDDSQADKQLVTKLASTAMPDATTLDTARRQICQQGKPPRVLDMFGGGGTIAFEAALLGADSHAIDSNQMSVFLQKSLLDYSQRIPHDRLIELTRTSGKRVLQRLTRMTSPLFPLRGKTFGYLWTYLLPCPECDYRICLSKRPWLVKRKSRRTALDIREGRKEPTIAVRQVDARFQASSVWPPRGGKVVCPHCQATIEDISATAASDKLAAIVSRDGHGKTYAQATDAALPEAIEIQRRERRLLKRMGGQLPTSPLPRWSGIVNPALYGIATHADFLNPRQRVVLIALIECLQKEHARLCNDLDPVTARAVIGLLSALIDQLVDWNCRLSMWIPQNEQVGRAFSGPGVAMLWDYCETDPVLDGPANLWKKLDRIIAGADALDVLPSAVCVKRGHAQSLPYPDAHFDAIVTDPPYYDNLFYNALADFFYAWKRLLGQKIAPELFRDTLTESRHELVASAFRSGDAERAHEDYCRELGLAMREAARVLKPDGVFSMVYGHSSLRGWEAIVRAFRPTTLRITSVQPLNVERSARPRAMTAATVNTCVALVSHLATAPKRASSINAISTALRSRLPALIEDLRKADWRDADIAVAAYAQGVAMLANAKRVGGCENDAAALRQIESQVQQPFPDFRLARRKSL